MNISEFDNLLKSSTSQQQAEGFLKRYLNQFDFQSFAFTYYLGHIRTGRKLRYHCVSDALRVWHLHYLEQNYADIDRTLEKNHTDTIPHFWDVQVQLSQAKNKREYCMRQESIEFGIDKGLSIPIHGPNNDFISVTLHQRRGETSLNHYKTKQYEWVAASYVYYHHIKRILTLNEINVSVKFPLTKREEQCLQLTAQSWRVERIAKELDISTSTVNFHLQNANKKLGAKNKYQAINLILLGN